MNKRYTPEYITSLKDNEVFVFGSNLAGHHGGGAARVARMKFGAVMGQGVGLQGQSYAIPTMQGGVETIKPYVDEFIDFARKNPQLTFYVTPIGCGIAGFEPKQIAPLFYDAFGVENIILPKPFFDIINHAHQLASETEGIVFHNIPLKLFDEDMKKAESMTPEEKKAFIIMLKKQERYTVKHESPTAAGNILDTDENGHHKIAISDNGFAIAAGSKLYSAEWAWGLDFESGILSVIAVEKIETSNVIKGFGNFAVLLCDGRIIYVWSEHNLNPLFPANDFVAVESGCGGLIFGLHRDGTLSVANEENSPVIAAEVRTWKDITQISTSRKHIIGLAKDGTVVIGGDKQHFEDAQNWCNIKKIYAFDTNFPANNDQVFGIDEDGWLYVTGCPWNDARQYWRKLRAQYDVCDIVSNHDATLVRYIDGSCRLVTPHAMHNFEDDMAFIHKYDNFRFLAARGDMVVIVDKDGEFRIDVDKKERRWWK